MHEQSQLNVPPSFLALFMAPGQSRPVQSFRDISQRYELCEDLAQALTEQARMLQHQLGITEDLVLEQCLQGLRGPYSVLLDKEARWVVCRLAELLQWPMPPSPVAPP
jgi:hypothetical protein